MKTLLVLFFAVISSTFAQYIEERTTEQNFEHSEIFFKSHFLNPFGLHSFKDVSAGLIDHPFLNLKINPANIPDLTGSDILLYLDFRGDRTEASYFADYPVSPAYYGRDWYPGWYPIDRRWLTITRTEPEPVVSFGLLFNPLNDITKNFYIGGTYQFIRSNEKFYELPYSIYRYNYYYDAFGAREGDVAEVPIIDRYSGRDEMTINGHLFSFFTGYEFFKDFRLGFAFNGILHTRDGGYKNSYLDEYGDTQNWKWNSLNSQEREQNYEHLDFSIGANYKLSPSFLIGIKGGYLKGKTDQRYEASNMHSYQNNSPDISSNWYLSFSEGETKQNWNQDGNTTYLGFNFTINYKDGKQLSGYYVYNKTKIDFTNNSSITDTSHYSNRWEYDSKWFQHRGHSAALDIRTGSGTRDKTSHEGMVSFKWKLNEKTTLTTGVYFSLLITDVISTEPASVYRSSFYRTINWENVTYQNYRRLIEDKTLVWEYNSSLTSIQIPLLFNFKINDTWGIDLGISRIVNAWNIKDVTTAYFNKRERTDDDSTKVETNFGERYKMPDEKISEDFLKFMTSLNVNISKDFKTRIMFEPEFDPTIRVAQWWLAFEARF